MKFPPTLALVLAAGLVVLTGCSSTTPTRVETGAISARTFNFIGTMPKPTPGYADQRQAVHTMVQQAIAKNLAGKGINQVTNNGDVTVAYLIIVGNNASTVSINDYFGYRDDAQALHEKAFDAYTGSKVPNYFEAGTLVIDFIDPKTFKVLKRNFATQPVIRNLADEARAERIQGIVDKILADVRVKP